MHNDAKLIAVFVGCVFVVCVQLTFVVAVLCQPFSFRAVVGADDAHGVSNLHRQVVFTALTVLDDFNMINGLFLACDLHSTSVHTQTVSLTSAHHLTDLKKNSCC